MDESNPFQSPSSSEATAVPPPKRPVSPMVIGIISIVFAAFGIFGTAMTVAMFVMFAIMDNPEIDNAYAQMGFSTGFLWFSTAAGFIFTLVLLAAGIGLVRYRNWGRLCFNSYAVITILWSVSQSLYMLVNLFSIGSAQPDLQAGMIGGAIGGAIGGLLGLIFPILGLVFLNLQRVRESLL